MIEHLVPAIQVGVSLPAQPLSWTAQLEENGDVADGLAGPFFSRIVNKRWRFSVAIKANPPRGGFAKLMGLSGRVGSRATELRWGYATGLEENPTITRSAIAKRHHDALSELAEILLRHDPELGACVAKAKHGGGIPSPAKKPLETAAFQAECMLSLARIVDEQLTPKRRGRPPKAAHRP